MEVMFVCHNILNIIFRDTVGRFEGGERCSAETKKSRPENELLFADGDQSSLGNHILGRKIDILVSIDGAEMACCEWKQRGVSITMAHKQESEKMRSYSCICNGILNLPSAADSLHTLFMTEISERR